MYTTFDFAASVFELLSRDARELRSEHSAVELTLNHGFVTDRCGRQGFVISNIVKSCTRTMSVIEQGRLIKAM